MEISEAKTSVLAIDDSAPIESILDALNKVNFIREMERELRKDLTARMISYIRQNGAIRMGTKKWIVGAKKTTKNKDRVHTLKCLYQACAGDLDLLASEFLGSDPFRQGACKDALSPEVWGECFEVTTKDELREGKPAVDLIELDERFVGSKAVESQGEASQE